MNILTSKLGFKILILVSECNVRNMESPLGEFSSDVIINNYTPRRVTLSSRIANVYILSRTDSQMLQTTRCIRGSIWST